MSKKNEMTDEKIEHKGKTLYRIKALKDFLNVEKGDLGGYVEDYTNLSQDDNCWIYNDAKVYDNARIYDNVKIYGNAKIYDKVEIYDYAEIGGNAEVYGRA